MQEKPFVVIGHANARVLLDACVRLSEGLAKHLDGPVKPEDVLFLGGQVFDKVPLDDAVHPQGIHTLAGKVQAPFGCPRAGRRQIVAVCSLDQRKGDENL